MRKQFQEMFAGLLFGLLLSGSALAQETRMAFGPGEQAHYRVKYLGVTAGSARITVGAPMKQWGKQVWPLVALAKSESVAGVWPIKDKFVSYWDFNTQRVLGSDRYENHNQQRRRVRVKQSEDGRSALIIKQQEGEAPYEQTRELLEGTLDLAGATFALRNRKLEPGQEHSFPIFTGSKQFILKATVEAKEVVETQMGKQEAYRLRVYTDFSGKLKSKRDMNVWLTADERHLPVRLEAELVLGSLVAELTEYHQGRTVAMR
ncbi:MAG TPA: DUF3108 domain-containing protein [Myxococcaceae bacterium]|nr:DUF3108 domain-containing protein [Myxococcaceae bacterium]